MSDITFDFLQVTQDPSTVLPLQYGEMCSLDRLELQTLLGSLARQIQSLLAQRDTHLEVRENTAFSKTQFNL